MRTQIIAGNWKMHTTLAEASILVEGLKKALAATTTNRQVVVCPPFTGLSTVTDLVADTDIAVGAQNMYFEEKGAYTGEIAPAMLVDAGVKYVVLGHSERRQYFAETSETVNKKMLKCFEHGLIPIMCCGESLEERQGGTTEEVVGAQVKAGLAGLSNEEVEKVVIAYEPIWAIGTGLVPTVGDVAAMHGAIRAKLGGLAGGDTAGTMRILYGGSVNAENAAELLGADDVDGALVGGASLKAGKFVPIIVAASGL